MVYRESKWILIHAQIEHMSQEVTRRHFVRLISVGSVAGTYVPFSAVGDDGVVQRSKRTVMRLGPGLEGTTAIRRMAKNALFTGRIRLLHG